MLSKQQTPDRFSFNLTFDSLEAQASLHPRTSSPSVLDPRLTSPLEAPQRSCWWVWSVLNRSVLLAQAIVGSTRARPRSKPRGVTSQPSITLSSRPRSSPSWSSAPEPRSPSSTSSTSPVWRPTSVQVGRSSVLKRQGRNDRWTVRPSSTTDAHSQTWSPRRPAGL